MPAKLTLHDDLFYGLTWRVTTDIRPPILVQRGRDIDSKRHLEMRGEEQPISDNSLPYRLAIASTAYGPF